ncbi:hypothetical protein [Hyphomicrobium sp. DY-1]|uniref:hypothetical protein n=1 Tax=Hyphomicrobium sp. DY-1 TaxID=3075650 RepID=UPI0039C0EC60
MTKDVADWTIVAGNPARAVRSRKYGRFAESEDLSGEWEAFVAVVREQMPTALARCFSRGAYCDFPGDAPRVRPLADAVELAAMVGCDVPGFTQPQLIEILTSWQDEATGLVPGPYGEDAFERGTPQAANLEYSRSAYSVMSTGYALECLGIGLRYPVSVAHNMSSADLVDILDRLPWTDHAWQCGAWIDHFATACYFNAKHHGLERDMSDLQGWLAHKADAGSGLWGTCSPPGDFLQPVNGFYRLTRGAHAQYGWNIGTPDRVIDSVLAHAHDSRHMAEVSATACNVLDVVHPLYLCGRQTDYRRDEVRAVARFWLKRIRAHWQTDEGMRFKLSDTTPARLQATEMWLAVAWLCAHLLGFAGVDDPFRPRGVHRL